MKGSLIVVSAPSGAGKTSLTHAAIDQLASDGHDVSFSVSYTTRASRPGELDGRDYHFVSEETFVDMADRGAFLEHARVFDRRYGTGRERTLAVLEQGLDVVLDMSFIYGVTESPMGGHLAYDDNSTSAIRLQNGMMLYLRQIDHNLALVCMLNEKNFAQRALLDYNVNIFKESLKALIDEEKRNALSG